MSTTPTVFVVDEDPTHRALLTSMLTSMGFSTRVFETAAAYWHAFDANEPGCLILDVHVQADGKSLREQLAALPLASPLIFVSTDTDLALVVRIMRDGAIEYLQKRAYSQMELWESVQRGFEKDGRNRIAHARLLEMRSKLDTLTETERQVLKFVLRGNNNREIGDSLGISQAATEARRTRLMKKLGVSNLVSLVCYAIEAKFETGDDQGK